MSIGNTPASANTASSPSGNRQYSTFYVQGVLFGLNVVEVQEVLRCQELTRVPLAPPVVAGLANLRGQMVTSIDMRLRLSLQPRKSGEVPMSMVVQSQDGPVSLLVDEIGDVVDVRNDLFEPPPDNIPESQRSLLEGIYKLEGHLLLVLSRSRVLQL